MTPVPISIITVCFNAEATIAETLRTVHAEGYPGLQHVVIDGGSTDRTLEILGGYRDRIAVLVSEPDTGISHAFNKGIARSEGEIVGIVSADDVLPEGVLSRMQALVLDHPWADVIYGDTLCLEGARSLHVPVDPHFSRLPERHVIRHASMWVKRSAYSRYGGFDESLRLAMDYDLALRLFMRGASFHPERAVLGAFRTGGANQRQRLVAMREMEQIMVRHGMAPWRARWLLYRKIAKFNVRRAIPEPLLTPGLAVLRRWRQGITTVG